MKAKFPRPSKLRGFTLLEMLLVIAIIAILAAIVIVAINPARQLAQAQNAARLSDLKEIHNAIQQYYIDHLDWPTGTMPTELTEICDTGDTEGDGDPDNDENGCDPLIDLSELVPTYLQAIPVDPSGPLTFINQAHAAAGGTGYYFALQGSSNVVLSTAESKSAVQGLSLVALGTTTPGGADEEGGGDEDCYEEAVTNDDIRLCDLAAINDAIQEFIDDNGHAPYLSAISGEVDVCSTAPDIGCYVSETKDWDVLADELQEYIDPLPEDPCGEACFESDPELVWFSYEYEAPAMFAAWNANAPEECTAESGCFSVEAYFLGVENLEDSEGVIDYGFGSF